MRVNVQNEAIAGVTTFFTMAYILFVNPSILATEGTGMSFSGVLSATVLVSFLMTLVMGLYARLPYAVAPGMGINAFFAFTIVLGQGVSWQIALGMVFWSGVFFVLISVTPIRALIAQAIPLQLRIAAGVGIGLFLAMIGFKNTGLIVSDPVTLVKFGGLSDTVLLSLGGIFLILWLEKKKNPFAFLAGILFVTLVAALIGKITPPTQFFSRPDFSSVFFQLDIWGALKIAFLPTIVTLVFTDLFDSLSTFVGVAQSSGMIDKQGNPTRLKEGLIVDSFATLSSGLLGSSPGTTYIESTAGIEAGGRTGLTSVFTALCFLPCLFLAPLVGVIPPYATAPVLIVIGALMFRTVSQLNFKAIEDVVPAFLTMILIPLTFSITQGILWGFVTHVLLYVLVGRSREIPPMLYLLSLLSISLLLIESAR